MNRFAKLLADADPETVAKLQALASVEIALAERQQANELVRIANAVERYVSGTVGRKEAEEQQFNEAIGELIERNRKSS